MPLTVHLVFNAHIDPVWLWPWPAGLDEALATCRSACDRLDANPDLIFTRGEAWVYRMIEQTDPALFARIRKHIDGGRWSVVGGWWVQPDCNQPSAWAMRKQIDLGQRYFRDTLGAAPKVAYNVDSFGHAATLPAMMYEAGQRYYVMMRPQEHEMNLPARLFRSRAPAPPGITGSPETPGMRGTPASAETPGGPEIITFRIAQSYCTGFDMSFEHLAERVRAAATHLPPGIEHTMCFMGVGDHGGGPTEKMVALCRKHAGDIPGAHLVFSSPQKFFDAIAPQAATLPLVTGELQHHAVGCYSVHRGVKTALRRAEHLLVQAQAAHAIDPAPAADDHSELDRAWRRVAFNHFHDTLGGTCIPSAYPQVEAQLGQAAAIADDIIHLALRRHLRALPDDACQRVVLFNASDQPFDDYTEFDPWLGWAAWTHSWQLLDEAGKAVLWQIVEHEAKASMNLPRISCRVRADAGQVRLLRIERKGGQPIPHQVTASADGVANGVASLNLSHRTMALGTTPAAVAAAHPVAGAPLDGTLETSNLKLETTHAIGLPCLALIPDPTDTWSHDIDCYAAGPVTSAVVNDPAIIETGPLRAALAQTGQIGLSPFVMEWRIYAGEPCIELLLRIDWREENKVLKLVVPAHAPFASRTDGIPGGWLGRPNSGKEAPVRDFTILGLGHAMLGVVCPDVYALDATPRRLRLTLLRAPRMAHHLPHTGVDPRTHFADRGEHSFRFRFLAADAIDPKILDQQAMGMQRPLIYASVTRGMPCSFTP